MRYDRQSARSDPRVAAKASVGHRVANRPLALIAGILVAGGLALGTAGCADNVPPNGTSSSDQTVSKPTGAVAVPPSTPAKLSPSEVYLETLEEYGLSKAGTPESLVELGETVCKTFDSGDSFAQVLQVFQSQGWDSADAGHLIGASIGALCPEHLDEIAK